MIEIEIDGKILQAEPGSMIIEIADQVGIPIPRFCYHKKLSIAANCRMCLVEVEKSPKPLPACATPITAGMKIRTCSAKAREAQKSVMEFLLINHPLDCPICDQGGECELQDLSLTYGRDVSRFNMGKRAVKDDDLGPLIETEMTRCIQCTRCVRFGEEVAGFRELGATGRGEDMQITTYIRHSMSSELSGNIIDLCPVGALTSKPYLYKARPWELQQAESIAAHDGIGSNIYIHTRRNKVMRVVPHENESINEMWLSDRDRFSYLALESEERLLQPMIKLNDVWQETSWEEALAFAVNGLQKVLAQYGAKQMAALASPSATTEELFLLQKLMRGLGSHTIDHRIHQTDFSDQKHAPFYPDMGIKIAEIEKQDLIVLLGANVQREVPIVAHRIRKATLRGSKVLSVNLVDYPCNFEQSDKIVTAPDKLINVLAGIAKALLTEQHASLLEVTELLKDVRPDAAAKQFAEQLKFGSQKVILLGALAQNHPEAATVRALAKLIASLSQAKFGYLSEGANSAGAWLAGAVPHRAPAGQPIAEVGLAASTALAASLPAYLLYGIEPELDCANPAAALNALAKAEFVLAFSPFKAEGYTQYADVILPIAQLAETAGTLVNIEGRWQSFKAAVTPFAEVRAGWDVLRTLAQQLQLPGFEYEDCAAVCAELKQIVDNAVMAEEKWFCPKEISAPVKRKGLMRLTEWPIYSTDSVVRRAQALQRSLTNEPTGIYMHADLAARMQLHDGIWVNVVQGSAQAQLPVIISARIPDECVWIPAGRPETANLGAAFGEVEIICM